MSFQNFEFPSSFRDIATCLSGEVVIAQIATMVKIAKLTLPVVRYDAKLSTPGVRLSKFDLEVFLINF